MVGPFVTEISFLWYLWCVLMDFFGNLSSVNLDTKMDELVSGFVGP